MPTSASLLTAGAPPHSARAAVVLLHGRGATAEGIVGLGAELGDSVAVVAPQAPAIGGVPQWYPASFLAPLAANQPWLDQALAAVGAAVAHLDAQGVPRERVAIGGFSQGACLGLEYVARAGGRWGAAFALSGALIGTGPGPADAATLRGAGGLFPDKAFDYEHTLHGTPAFIGCGDPDPHIPAARVERSARVLRDIGAETDARLYPGAGHTIVQDEVRAVRTLLHGIG